MCLTLILADLNFVGNNECALGGSDVGFIFDREAYLLS